MNPFALFFYILTVLWVVGGFLLIVWLYDYRIKGFARNSWKFFKEFVPRSWKSFKEFVPKALLFIAMMGPFFIPIIVSAICLFFS